MLEIAKFKLTFMKRVVRTLFTVVSFSPSNGGKFCLGAKKRFRSCQTQVYNFASVALFFASSDLILQ